MSNLAFPRFADWILRNGGLQAIDLRCLLFSVGSSVSSEPDAEFLDDFTNLLETDSPDHVRQDLGGVALTYQAGALRSEFTSAVATFGALNPGPAALPIAGALWFAQLGGGSDAENRPIECVRTTALGGLVFPYTLTGATVTVTPSASGWLRVMSAGASLST